MIAQTISSNYKFSFFADIGWYEPDYVKNCKEPVNKTPSLLDTHYHQGGECQYCGCYFNSLMKLAEHQDTCDKRNDFE